MALRELGGRWREEPWFPHLCNSGDLARPGRGWGRASANALQKAGRRSSCRWKEATGKDFSTKLPSLLKEMLLPFSGAGIELDRNVSVHDLVLRIPTSL